MSYFCSYTKQSQQNKACKVYKHLVDDMLTPPCCLYIPVSVVFLNSDSVLFYTAGSIVPPVLEKSILHNAALYTLGARSGGSQQSIQLTAKI